MITKPEKRAHHAITSANAATESSGRAKMKTPTVRANRPRSRSAHQARLNTLLRSSSTAVVISPPLGFAPFTRPSSTALLSLGHDSSRGLKKPRGQGAEHHAANMCHVAHPPCLRCSEGTDAHQLEDKPHPEQQCCRDEREPAEHDDDGNRSDLTASVGRPK